MNDSILRKPFRYSYFNATIYLIIANIAVFFLTSVFRTATINRVPLIYYLGLSPAGIFQLDAYWQFVTYMFTHGGLWHILFNMFGLFLFGTALEQRIGSKEFLLFYMLCGILAGVFSFFLYWATGVMAVPLVGASGALFAVLLAYATFFPNSVIFLFGILPVRAPVLVIGYTILELFNEVTGFQSGVAHMTHLAGFAFAFLYLLVRLGINPIAVFTGKDTRFHR